ncbi:MAG: hypothetical protein VB115_15170 [Christensenellaceae bacterium]|nr:hypothetical protein [Christensenellaceae bacterium]
MSSYDPSIIPIGPENAISRAALARLWGVGQRTAREIIHDLRAEDDGDPYVIVSTSTGRSGYFRTVDPQIIERFIRETKSRAINTFAPLKKARRVLASVAAPSAASV